MSSSFISDVLLVCIFRNNTTSLLMLGVCSFTGTEIENYIAIMLKIFFFFVCVYILVRMFFSFYILDLIPSHCVEIMTKQIAVFCHKISL